ncbi:MAG: hypothetical protein KAX49_19460 [Halanaerobiales bacterium]|nr:hypothetical protein [Halanaerobiales bacterium]
MKKFSFLLILISILTLIFPTISLSNEQGKFVILLLDQLSLKEISQYGGPVFIQLFDESAQALLNVRTDYGIKTEYTYQAFGAGNRGEKYGAVSGMLGELLKVNNYKVAVYGNMDYGTEENRKVMTIVMDNNSHLFYGDVTKNVLLKDSIFPGNWRTDYQKMTELFLEGYDKYDLIVLEVGDLARIKRGLKEEILTKDEEEFLMQVTFERIDRLLGMVKARLNLTQDRLMVVAPTPDSSEIRIGAKLSWVLLTGINYEMGVLKTGTTRRPGLVTISDLAPTVLEYFQIPTPTEMTGRLIITDQVTHGGLSRLMNLNQQIVRTSEWRPWYIKAFILIQIIGLFLATLIFFSRKIVPEIWWKVVRIWLLGIMFIPLFFLVLSPYNLSDFTGYLIILFFLIALGTWLIEKLHKNPLASVVTIIIVTIILILFDIFRGSPWMSRSILGYCPIIGARFYGLGNEYMGLLVGGTLMGWTGLLDLCSWFEERKMILTPIVFIAIMSIIGFPLLGANLGGAITAIAAFTSTYVLMVEKSKRIKIIFVIAGAMFIILGIFILADTYSLAGERSHFGQTINLLRNQGFSAFMEIITRKLSMNLKLLRWTIWTRVLITFIIVLVLLFKRPRGALSKLITTMPNLFLGFIGVIIGSVVTIIVNDSGVVAAATLLFYAILPLIYLTTFSEG